MANQTPSWLGRLGQIEPFLPFDNPTFGNPAFEEAKCRVLIARLSPFRDVDRSLPHLFLFHEVRRALPAAYVDLAFFPTAAQRRLFEREGVSFLLGTQSLRPASAFDLILISNAYTLELINLPYLLLHSGIPLFAGERGPAWPIILLGGSNAMAAQAVIRADGDSLVDGIFFGEGEGLVSELVSKQIGKPAPSTVEGAADRQIDKRELLGRIARQIPGLWVPKSLHEATKVTCRPETHLLPVDYPILNTPEAHTAHLQITHGCPAFCSFCFEGYDRQPYRELPLADILAAARRLKQVQGVEEVSLYSFNFNTHADILEMIPALHRLFDRVSLKSQRLDILQHTPALLEAEVEADKREFTLGIEGISARQRTFLHKSLATEEITALLEALLAQPIRRIKLFYVLTGYETEEDVAEFRDFVRWLKETRRAHERKPRIIFSFGLLIRMPFTPLQYDRLFLDETDWKQIIGPAKSACETNGFEFRLAFDWPTYCTNQVLAMGGTWLNEPLVALAREGYCFDTTLPPTYWDELQGWMRRTAHWNEAFLREKGPDYPFPLAFVRSSIPPEFLRRQYQQAKAGRDAGYCLGSVAALNGAEERGRCLGCGACADDAQRQAITRHQIRQPEDTGRYLAQLQEVMARKRQAQPIYYRLRLESWLAGVEPAFCNAFVLKGLLTRYPDLVDSLLAAREGLFTVTPLDRQFPGVSGETVFALKAWDVEALRDALADSHEWAGSGFEILGPADGFVPGAFAQFHLDLHLPASCFPEPRTRFEAYLRGAYLPYSLRREGERLAIDLPTKALKKRILFGGFIEEREDGFAASLDAGPKFDLGAFLQTFDGKGLHHCIQAQASGITW